jgi:hypothetical protein
MPLMLLDEDSKPFVILNQLKMPLPWNTGFFLKVRLQASHTIITSNAIVYFRNDPLSDLMSSAWTSFTCTQNDDSLCLHSPELDMFNTMSIQEPYVYSESLRQQYRFGADVCSKNSARQLVDESMYTVSMCDLIDTQAQFVLVERADQRHMYMKNDSTSITEYAVLACVCLYAVATLAKHGIMLIKVDNNAQKEMEVTFSISQFIPQSILKYVRMSILHVILSMYIAVAVSIDIPSIATRSESWLALYLIVHVLIDCVFCVRKLFYNLKEELKQINVMVVLLMLCCLRIYHTFQNVFHVLLTVMFAIRTCCKLILVLLINSSPTANESKIFELNSSVVYDILTLYLLLLCMSYTTESEFHGQNLHISILSIGLLLGAVLALVHKTK